MSDLQELRRQEEAANRVAQETRQRREIAERAERAAALEPFKDLAVLAHDTLCSWNHTDGCGWGSGYVLEPTAASCAPSALLFVSQKAPASVKGCGMHSRAGGRVQPRPQSAKDSGTAARPTSRRTHLLLGPCVSDAHPVHLHAPSRKVHSHDRLRVRRMVVRMAIEDCIGDLARRKRLVRVRQDVVDLRGPVEAASLRSVVGGRRLRLGAPPRPRGRALDVCRHSRRWHHARGVQTHA